MILLLALLSCAGKDVRTYDTDLLHLGTGYNARMACSCVFVLGRDEESCQDLLKVSPDLARFQVDREAGTVTSKALGGWRRTARFVDAQVGCVLEE
ncbi:hypothetical protein L6R53_16120 [Myxococcota bacterium]|nr:hypothetical protein [Myxococcota bacterium]